MGEDETDLFSIKLEDIHLARHSSVALNNHQPTNQLPGGFAQKKNEDVLSGMGNGQDGLSNYWQQIFDDAQPVVPQDILPNLMSEESVDFSRDFFFKQSADADNPDLNVVPAQLNSGDLFDLSASNFVVIPTACESPVPFNRSRPASPNPKEENGSEKKRVKFERSENREMGPPQNGLVYFESQNGAPREVVLNRKTSNTQAVITQGFNGVGNSQPNIVSDLSEVRYVSPQHQSQVQNLSVSPVLSAPYMERRFSNGSGKIIMINQSPPNGLVGNQSSAGSVVINQSVTRIKQSMMNSIFSNQAVTSNQLGHQSGTNGMLSNELVSSSHLGNQSSNHHGNQSLVNNQSGTNGFLGNQSSNHLVNQVTHHHLLNQAISSVLVPDSTELQVIRGSSMRPPSERSFSHSRSVSTSPEPRDEVDRKDSRVRDKNSRVPRHKRPSHINAEHRRRSKIQGGIEELNQLLPPIAGDSRASVGTSKKSNAALLGRAAGYCRQLKAECRERERESETLRSQIESLTTEINNYHEILPADGVTQTKVATSVSMEQMFYSYVRSSIHSNWKFYLFGLLIRPFFESYNRMVASASMRDFPAAVVRWSQDCFTLSAFRLNTTPVFRHISKKTSFMITPENLPQEALELSATIGRSHIDSSGNTVTSSSSTSAAASSFSPCFTSTSVDPPTFTKSSPSNGAHFDR